MGNFNSLDSLLNQEQPSTTPTPNPVSASQPAPLDSLLSQGSAEASPKSAPQSLDSILQTAEPSDGTGLAGNVFSGLSNLAHNSLLDIPSRLWKEGGDIYHGDWNALQTDIRHNLFSAVNPFAKPTTVDQYTEATPTPGGAVPKGKGAWETVKGVANMSLAGEFHRKGAGPIEGEAEDWITGQLNPVNIGLAIATMGGSAVESALVKAGIKATKAAGIVRYAKVGADLAFLSKFGYDVGTKAIPQFEQDWKDVQTATNDAEKKKAIEKMERDGTDLVLGSLSMGLASRGVTDGLSEIHANSPKGKAVANNDYNTAIHEYQAENQIGAGQAHTLHREGVAAVPDAVRREGIANNIEAQGDINQLRQWEQQASANPNTKEHSDGYKAGQTLTPKEQTLQARLKSILDAWKERLRQHNLLATDGGKDNYLPHKYDFEDVDPTTGDPINHTGASGERDFLKKRTFDNYAQAEQNGLSPKSKDAVKLVADYVERANNMIARDNLAEGLANGQMNEGSPMAVSGGYMGVPHDLELSPAEVLKLEASGQLKELIAKGRVYEVPAKPQTQAPGSPQAPAAQPSAPAPTPAPAPAPRGLLEAPKPPAPKSTPLPEGAEQFDAKNLQPGQQTAEAYQEGTPQYEERVAYQQRVKKEFLDNAKPVPEGHQPVAIVLGGGTASGKSRMVRNLELDKSAVSVDTDKVRSRLPEYRDLQKSDPQNASRLVHQEAASISKQILSEATGQRKNVVVDSTTSGTGDAEMIRDLKAKGYKVELHFVDTPTDIAHVWEQDRFENSPFEESRGRKTPRERIESTHQGAAKAFLDLRNLADEAHLYDNSEWGRDYHEVYKRVGKEPEKVYNQGRLDEYTRKANGQETRVGADTPRGRELQEQVQREVRSAADRSGRADVRPVLSTVPRQVSGEGSGSLDRPKNPLNGRKVIPTPEKQYNWKFSDYQDSGLRANRPLASQPAGPGSDIVSHPDPNAFPGEAIMAQGESGIPTDPKTGKRMMRVPVFAHPEIMPHLRDMLDTSAPKNAFVRGALKVSGAAKSVLLSISPFHWNTILMRSLEAGMNPGRGIKQILMPAPVDYYNLTDAQHAAIRDGLVVANTRPGHSGYLEEGNIAGHDSFANKIPLIGPFNRWIEHRLFGPQGFITGLKFDLYGKLKPELMKSNPGLSEEQAGRIAAAQINNKFGGLNYTLLGRSASTQAAMRAALLAPDFLESTGRSLVDVAGKHGQPLLKSLVAFNILHYLTARVMNYVVNGQFHPESGFSVNSPDGKKEYGIRTTLGDFLHFAEHPRDFMMNRVNPLLVRTPVELLYGVDQQGNKVSNTQKMWDTIRQVVPIPFSAATPKQQISQPNSLDDLLKSVGVQSRKKFSPAETLAMQRSSQRNESGPLEGDALDSAQRKYKLEDDLREALSSKDIAGAKSATQAIVNAAKGKDATITYQQATQMINDAHVYKNRLEGTIRRLTLEDALDVYEAAGIQEKKQIRNEINRKIMSWYKAAEQGKKTPGQLGSMRPRVSKFLKDRAA